MFLPTAAAEHLAAVRAGLQAGGADGLSAGRAHAQTTQAGGLLASVTQTDTLLAIIVSAVFTIPQVLDVAGVAAVKAGLAVPVLDGNIRALGIVGLQDRSYDQHCIAEAPGLQRPAEGFGRFAETEQPVADVRVSDGRIRARRVRVQGLDTQRRTAPGCRQSVEVKMNAEGTEVLPLERDGLGDDEQLLGGVRKIDRRELFGDLIQFGEEFAEGRWGDFPASCQLAGQLRGAVRQIPKQLMEVIGRPAPGLGPAVLRGLPAETVATLDFPEIGGNVVRRILQIGSLFLAEPKKLVSNRLGETQAVP